MSHFTVFYQRPVEDPFHGGSNHLRNFALALSRYARVRIVAPPARHGSLTDYEVPSPALAIAYLIRACAKQARLFLRDGLVRRADASEVVLVFDSYAGLLPLIWSKVRGLRFVYYAQDFGPRVGTALEKVSEKGGTLRKLLRWPLERALIHNATLLIAVSDVLRMDLVGFGVPQDKVLVCRMPRTPSEPDIERVHSWREKLAPRGSVLVLFVGNMGYPPNQVAVAYIRGKLLPALAGCRCPWRMILAGPGTDVSEGIAENTVRLGAVEDLHSLLFACNIGIAPMEVEGGVSGKVVDYLTHGLSVVATPQAASGIPECAPLIISRLEEFASTLRNLIDRTPPDGRIEREVDEKIREAFFAGTDVADLATWATRTNFVDPLQSRSEVKSSERRM